MQQGVRDATLQQRQARQAQGLACTDGASVPPERSNALERAVLGRRGEQLVVDKCLAACGREEGGKEGCVVWLGNGSGLGFRAVSRW